MMQQMGFLVSEGMMDDLVKDEELTDILTFCICECEFYKLPEYVHSDKGKSPMSAEPIKYPVSVNWK